MARRTSAAATAESTPPDSPQTARPSPTWARMAATEVSTMQSGVQAGAQSQASYRKFSQHALTVGSVRHLRVKLHAEQAAVGMLEGRGRRVGGHGGHGGPGRGTHHRVAMAHPDLLGRGKLGGDHPPRSRHGELHAAVLRQAAAIHLAPEFVGQELRPVADAEHRHSQRQDLGIQPGRAGGMHRLGSTAENQPCRPATPQPRGADVVRNDLAVDVGFAHPSGDELGVLGTEVDDQHAAAPGGRAACGGHRPMPTPCRCCRAFPSLAIDGATITSAFWSSLSVA